MKRGFTLLELVLALALMTVVIGIVAMSLDLHVQQVVRLSRAQQTSAVAQLIATSLERDVQAVCSESVAARARSASRNHRPHVRSRWRGTASGVALIRVTDEPRPLRSSWRGVVYQFVDRPGQHALNWIEEHPAVNFQVAEAGLVRLEVELDQLSGKPRGPVRVDWVATDLRAVRWEFYASGGWQNAWNDLDDLPQAVQVSWMNSTMQRGDAPVRIMTAIPSARLQGAR
jgi:prepilin-type N-terminal cleavage/methylation domain-containing protein